MFTAFLTKIGNKKFLFLSPSQLAIILVSQTQCHCFFVHLFIIFFNMNHKYTLSFYIYLFSFAVTILFSVETFAQIKPIQEPKFETIQPTSEPSSYLQMGGNAEDIIRQQNDQARKMMGYTPPPTREQIAKGNYYDDIAKSRALKQKEFFKEINELDNSSKTIDPKRLAEYEKSKRDLRLADTSSVDYKMYRKYYDKSYAEIVGMLSEKSPLNLKRAVFLVENPFYKNKLSYEKYSKQIENLVFVCKQIMQKEGLDPKNYMACHYAIQKLFSEKFTYKNSLGKDELFEPFTYDLSIYDQEKDHKDWTEQHVTKLLNQKMGQCHSMPLLYLILAEGLNANAYLALAPNHSYVKFGNQNQAYSFETTNGTFTSDEWIVSSGYVSSTAIKNQIYLAPLTKEQIIAECLVDLESGLEFLHGKSDFDIKCANTTLKFFPTSINAVLTISNMIVAECAKTASKYHFPKYDEYYKYPKLKKQFDEMLDVELKVEQTGYQKISNEQYEKWRQSANEEKEKREHLKLISKLQESAKK